jgi:predicted peptidase
MFLFLSMTPFILMSMGHVREQPAAGSQTEMKYTVPGSSGAVIRYLLYLPPGYDPKENKEYPLLVCLHGAGSRGDDINLVKRAGPPMLADKGKIFPFVIISPQCAAGKNWDPEILYPLITGSIRKFRIDKSRIYLTGYSMGGYGTWNLAFHHPELFAAIIPICGDAYPYQAEKMKEIAIWVFHGDKDEVVPLSFSREMVDALKKSGGNPRFTVYPGTGHDSWTRTYDNPEIYDWLLMQSK